VEGTTIPPTTSTKTTTPDQTICNRGDTKGQHNPGQRLFPSECTDTQLPCSGHLVLRPQLGKGEGWFGLHISVVDINCHVMFGGVYH
jgi:hypothetical protein